MMNNKEKTMLGFFLALVSFAITVMVYAMVYGLGIQLMAEELGYPLPDINVFVFVILAALNQLCTCGKPIDKKDSVPIDSPEFGKRFINWTVSKIFWIIVCIILYSIYTYVK